MERSLNNLKNTTNKRKSLKKLGRGIGSGHGKTSGRGHKGAGSRSGYKRRYGKEGGQFPLYMKLPTRGFTRGRFRKTVIVVNLKQVDKLFRDNEVVNVLTLKERGYCSGHVDALKVLAEGDIHKKVTFEVNAISKQARQKIEKAGLEIKLI